MAQSSKEVLDGLEKAMGRCLEAQKGDGKELHCSELALMASVELPCGENDGF